MFILIMNIQNQPSYNFNSLPVELIIRVLFHVAESDHLDRFAVVSKLWAQAVPLAKIDRLNETETCLSALGIKNVFNAVKKILNETPIKCARLNKFDLNDIYILRLARVARRIQSLYLSNSSSVTEKGLVEFVSKLINLEKLSVHACQHFKTNKLVEAIFQKKYLKELDLSGCPHIYAPSISKLGSLSNLTILNLSDCRRLMNSPKFFKKIPNLKVLDLTGLEIEAKHLTAIFSYLTKLEELNLTRCNFYKLNISELRNLKINKFLRSINLSGIKPGNKRAELLLKFPSLKQLILRDNFIDGEMLMLALLKLSDLESLDLSASYIYFFFGRYLKPHNNLVNLKIRGGERDTNFALIPVIENFVNLKFLDIRDRGLEVNHPIFKKIVSLIPNHQEILI